MIRPNLSEGQNEITNQSVEANLALRVFTEFDFEFSESWFRIQRAKCQRLQTNRNLASHKPGSTRATPLD